MKRPRLIGLLLFAALLAACVSHPRESERMASAMAQAEAVYGDGSLLVETDTALFIPGLAEASDYYARKRQYGEAALAAPLGVFAVLDSHIQPMGKGVYYVHYVHPDHLGSWTTVTGRNGKVVQDVWFDPWGTPYYSDSDTLTQVLK